MTAYIFVITARSSELQTLALVPTHHEAWASKCWSSDPWRLAKSWNPFSWSLGLRKPANICWTGYLLTVYSSKIHRSSCTQRRAPQSYVALHPSSDEANNVTILVLLKTNANPTPVRQVWNRSRCSAADFKFIYIITLLLILSPWFDTNAPAIQLSFFLQVLDPHRLTQHCITWVITKSLSVTAFVS